MIWQHISGFSEFSQITSIYIEVTKSSSPVGCSPYNVSIEQKSGDFHIEPSLSGGGQGGWIDQQNIKFPTSNQQKMLFWGLSLKHDHDQQPSM